jgi:amyloid beta precursor protein binding protein 1
VQADAVGAETLKNLVLPGIGSFTILDDHRVTADDLGNNFFVTMDSVGRPRAEVVCELLCEMNPEVKGHARVGNFQNLLETEPDYFSHFTLVLVANIPRYQLITLADFCWNAYVPLLCIRSIGFLGAVYVQAREHFIVDVRSDSSKHDLRIAQAFSGLQQLADEVLPPNCTYSVREHDDAAAVASSVAADASVLQLDSMHSSHIPYPLILLRVLTQWQQKQQLLGSTHHGHGLPTARLPRSYAEKQELREMVKTFLRGATQQKNVSEALKEAAQCWDSALPECLLWVISQEQEMDQDGDVEDEEEVANAINSWSYSAQEQLWRLAKQLYRSPVSPQSSLRDKSTVSDAFTHPKTATHRLLLATLCDFAKQTHALPLGGALPDMTATSELYTQLHQTYLTQARLDRGLFDQLLQHRLLDSSFRHHISHEDSAAVCSAAQSVGLLSTPPLFQGHVPDSRQLRGAGVRQAVEELLESFQELVQQQKQNVDGTNHDANSSTKNNSHMHMQSEEEDASEVVVGELEEELTSELQQSPVLWLLWLEAVEAFYCRHFRYPGDTLDATCVSSHQLERDSQLLLQEWRHLCDTLGLPVVELSRLLWRGGETHAKEFVRYGAAQLHCVSALVGGVAAQEAVKLATHIFVPINNSYVFNGVASLGAAFAL